MKNELLKIYDENVVHSAFLDKESILKGMNESYELGKKSNEEDYNKLKTAFLDLLESWGDYGKYNASRNHMEEDWKKHAGLL